MEDKNATATCKQCQCTMDVSTLQPFTNVECPECGEHMRVKVDVGAYVLRKRQGMGGMSLVFGAVDKTLGREVAIKILNEEYSMDEKRIKQFEQEARITAAMSHPHIVKVYTVGQAFNRFFIAMEMVSGDGLEEKMRENAALPEGDILHWAQQIADGLNAANEAGLIHRDIKPGNILFDKEGHVKIVDFGLALVTQGGKAQADEIWATPYYVPPEALDILEEDFRSDIYALGASLYHALCGHPPFSTESRSTTELKQIKQNIPPLKEVAPWLHDETCAIIDRAMAFEMDDRFSSYQELIDALHYTENIVLNEGANTPGTGAKRARRRSTIPWYQNSIIIGGVGAGLVLGVGAIVFLAIRAKDKPKKDIPIPVNTGSHSVVNTGSSRTKNVTKEINAARSFLKVKKYDEAALHYTHLAQGRNVAIDTVFWAGIQAATLHWLNGNPGEARKQLRHLVANNKGSAGSKSVIGKRLEKAVDSLTGYGKLDPALVPKIKNEIDAIIVFASGIKNWSFGHIEEAQVLFKRVSNCKISEPSEEFLFYQARINDYLDDAKIITALSEFSPVSKSECDARDEALNKVKFNTLGRVQFDLTEWRMQNEIHRKRFDREERARQAAKEKKENDPKLEWEKIVAVTDSLIKKCEFKKVEQYLTTLQLKGKGNDIRRDAILYLCDNAMGYKMGIMRNLSKKTTSITLYTTSRSEPFNTVYDVTNEGFVVRESAKNKTILWSEVTPSSVVDLHKYNVQGNISQFEKNIRLEQAVCFAKIMGDDEKANKGASILMEEDPSFKKRWEDCNKVLSEMP